MPEVRPPALPDPLSHEQVRTLVHRLADATTPPTPFDVDAALRGGRRRVARRRARTGVGMVALATVIAVGVAVPSLVQQSRHDRTPPPADRTPTPTATARAHVANPDRMMVSSVRATDAEHLVAVLRTSGSGAPSSALRLTTDGWATTTSHVLPGVSYVAAQVLPDGSAAFETDTDVLGVLHPDGTVTSVTRSDRPTDGGPGVLLFDIAPDERDGFALWLLDPTAATMRPLRHQPTGGRINPVVNRAPDGTVYLVGEANSGDAPAGTYRAQLYASSDDGRSWEARGTIATHSVNPTFGYLAAGPDGRVALLVSSDGATFTPFEQLWTSNDGGRSFLRQQPTHHPTYVGGMAYTPDGTLLVADESAARTWRSTGAGDLEPAPDLPFASSIWLTGELLVAQDGDLSLATSTDGTSWTTIDPARSRAYPWRPPQTQDEAVAAWLEHHPTGETSWLYRRAANKGGRLYCAARVVGHNAAGTRLYAAVVCAAYAAKPGGGVRVLSGSGGPVLVHATGAGPATDVSAVQWPRQQHLDLDMQRMFPSNVARLLQRNETLTPADDQLLATRAQAELGAPNR